MIRYLLTLLALLASPVAAQEWQTGPQTPSYPGGAENEYTGVVGDGSTTQGGTPPATAFEPADIPSTGITVEDWITSSGTVRSTGGAEHKARFTCESSHEKQEDPIIFPGMAKSGHRHRFIGNKGGGKDSNYSTLRADLRSTCAGGPLNPTLYWATAVLKLLPSGWEGSLKSDNTIFYYVHNATESPKRTRLFNGLAFIIGVNPEDPTDAPRKAEVPPGFAYITNGFDGWSCLNEDGGSSIDTVDDQPNSPSFILEGGGDPWGGACTAGKILEASATAPPCWDGKNLTSPNGRDHFRYLIRHINSGKAVCPDGWWQVPAFVVKERFTHNGFADYGTWFLSSDRHGLDEENWALPGSTYHADWMNGWDPEILKTWLVNCTGIKIGATEGNGADCDYGTISATQRLLSDSPSPDPTKSNDPIVNLGNTYYNDPNNVRFFPIPEGTKGPFTIHSHPDH